MLILDASHMILSANLAATRFLGETPGSLKDVSVLEVDLLARLLTAGSILQRLKSETPPIVDDITVADTEGQPLQCHIEAIPIPGARTLLHLQDTTAVLRARANQKSVEQLHRAVLDALTQVVWTMALPEERLLEISHSVEPLFGYQPSAFQERPDLWYELVHPAERERVRDEFRRGIGGGRPFEIHFTGLHRDHRDLPHLVNRVVPVADENGWVERCEGFIEDQGAQREMEASLRSAEANLRHTLESVSSGVLVVKPSERGPQIVICNRRLAQLLGLDEAPRLGTTLAQAPEALRSVALGRASAAELDRVLRSEDTFDEITELEAPQRVLRRYSSPVRNAAGLVVGRIVTIEDVTAAWRLQRRLTHAQKMESMGRLAGGVAHDFNNLLGTMMGFSALLLEQTPEGDPRRESLKEIVSAAERASHLTSALLTFSRTARFERIPVDLNKVVEESYQLLRSTLDPSVAIELKLAPELPTVLGDALLLQQLIVNLVQDAREDLAGGGSLRVSTRLDAKPRSVTETERIELQRHVALEIEVSVPAPDARARAAEGRADEARSGAEASSLETPGTGLALTIAEDIARAHGGYLISGTEARPALFRALFPVGAREEQAPMVPEVATARGHETILVVDDEPGLRALALTGLQQRGFDVITAEHGEQALEILRAENSQVNLVLLDLSMPGLSGERVLRAIRSFKPDLPVIIASGYASVESQAAWNAAGAQGFVAKPYRIQDVALKLRDVLDRAHGRVG